MERRAAEIVATCGFLVVGTYFLAASVQMGIGTLSEPEGGMLPAFGAAMLLLLGGIQLVMTIIGRVQGERISVNRVDGFKIALTIATLVVTAIAIPWIGFLLASAGMLFVLFFVVAKLPILPALIMTAAVAGTNYVVFAVLLGVPLP